MARSSLLSFLGALVLLSACEAPSDTPLATPPDAPTAVAATPGVRSAKVAWTAPENDNRAPVTRYIVTASAGGATASVDGAAREATVEGLADGTSYTFTVSAVNEAGIGAASAPSAPITTAAVPGEPMSVHADGGDGQVTVSWAPPASDGGDAITSYIVTIVGGASVTVDGATTEATLTGLVNGELISLQVAATNGVGTGPASSMVQATPAVLPSAPGAVVAVPGVRSVTVTWGAVENNGGASIISFLVTGEPGAGTVEVVGDQFSATFNDLGDDRTYTFSVRARNAEGVGPASSSAPVTTHALPGAPTITSVAHGDARVAVRWAAPSSDGRSAITSYRVHASPGDVTVEVEGDATEATVPGLTNGVAYTFVVTATNAVGTGVPSLSSESVTPATTPDVPTGVTATPGTRSLSVAWTAPDSDGGSAITGYEVTMFPGGTVRAVQGTTTTFTDLTSTIERTFTVRALNAEGAGVDSFASMPVKALPDAPVVSAATVSGASGCVRVDYTVRQSEGLPVTVAFAYAVNVNATFGVATKGEGSDGLVGLSSSAEGVSHLFRWDSVVDLPGQTEGEAVFRIVASVDRGGASEPLTVDAPIANAFSMRDQIITSTGAGTEPFSLAAGDFNGDGRRDLVTANSANNTVGVLLGNGDGSFMAPTLFSVRTFPTAVVVSDLNGDNKADVVAVNQSSNSVSVLLGRGNGTFAPESSYATGAFPFAVVVADVNHDAKPDIVTADASGISVIPGRGDGTFNAAQIHNVASGGLTAIVAGRFDADDRDDLAVTAGPANGVYVLIGRDDGSFNTPVLYAAGNNPGGVATADLNEDGALDLAISNVGSGSVSVLLGKPDGTFQTAVSTPATSIFTIRSADFDGDGHADLAYGTSAGTTVGLLFGDGTGTLGPARTFTVGTTANAMALNVWPADFDGDGRIDLASANRMENSVSVLRSVAPDRCR